MVELDHDKSLVLIQTWYRQHDTDMLDWKSRFHIV